jgi:hypothetical protein
METRAHPGTAGSDAADALHLRLRCVLADRNLAAVARTVGVSKESVRRYLAGAQPSVAFIAGVCCAYGVNADWLLCGRGPAYIGGPDDSTDAPPTVSHPLQSSCGAAGAAGAASVLGSSHHAAAHR